MKTFSAESRYTIVADNLSIGAGAAYVWVQETEPPQAVEGSSLEDVLARAKRRAGAARLAAARTDLATLLTDGDRPKSLKELRLAAGLSQADLADALHTSQPYIARLEGGQIKHPSGARVRELSAALTVPENVVLDCLE